MRPLRALPALLLLASLAACFRSTQEVDYSDPALRARIESALQAEPELELKYVSLDVHDRVVTVSGLVPSWNQKQRIYTIVRDTRGVDQVVLNLIIQE